MYRYNQSFLPIVVHNLMRKSLSKQAQLNAIDISVTGGILFMQVMSCIVKWGRKKQEVNWGKNKQSPTGQGRYN